MIPHTFGKTLLKIDNVSLSYGGKPVLKGVNAVIQEITREGSKGQVVGFLGPSGIGKTSLFRLMAGLEQPTSGMITLNGLNREVLPGEVGVVAQNYLLFNHRTVLSNLILAAEQKEHSTKDATEKTLALLDEFELSDKCNHYPVQLSGGQRQRVSILQQLLCSDHFLLADEPFSGLDIINKKKVCNFLTRAANSDTLNTVIVTSHDIQTACAIADHLWLLGRDRDSNGEIIPGAYIKKVYDLAELDLCWHGDIHERQEFRDFVSQVENEFVTL
jgi:polar amino acid transport system ATP-binding protein/sulfate transport system ATP-binding protein